MRDEHDDETRPGADETQLADEAQTEALLSALIDGELDSSEAASLRERMASEPALIERHAAFERLDAELRALPAPEVPGDLPTRMRARIAEQQGRPSEAALAVTDPSLSRRASRRAPPRSARRLWPAAAGLAAVAAAFVFYLRLPAAVPQLPVPRASEAPVSLLASAEDDELVIALYYDELADLDMLEKLELLEALAAIEEAEQG
jgi:anti-sigma factor RsiW